MLKIPELILSKLICIKCGGYLSSKPVMVNKVNQQVCGKCFNKLTIHEQKTYYHQAAYEAIIDYLVFPSRYQDSDFQLTYNSDSGECCIKENEHESACLLCPKHNIDHNISRQNVNNNEPIYNYAVIDNNDRVNSWNLSVDNSRQSAYYPKNDNNLTISTLNSSRSTQSSVGYSNIYTEIGKYTPIDPTLERCSNCQNFIDNTNLFHCLYGHYTCQSCKGDLCQKCDKIVLKNTGYRCKHISNGCRSLLLLDEVKEHESNCDYKLIKCPLVECQTNVLLKETREHFFQKHKEKLVEGNEVTATFREKDQHFYFLFNNDMFHGKYYVYDSEIEFLVEFIGRNDRAANYRYKIEFLSGDGAKNCETKIAQCAGWNVKLLNKGIGYELDYNKMLNFTAKLTIFK